MLDRKVLKKLPFGILLIFYASFLFLAGCPKKASDEIDFGTFTNATYQNKYFGLSVEIPPDWSIQDDEAQKQLIQTGSDILAGDDKNSKAIIEASCLQTVYLFTVFEHPVGSPVSYNPCIATVAEKIRNMPGIQRGRDYLYHARGFLEQSRLEATFSEEIPSEILGGVSFDVMSVEMSIKGMSVRQKYYATVMKGYALSFIISYGNDEQMSLLANILKTVHFDNPTVDVP